MTARALLRGEIDAIEFRIAEATGVSLEDVRSMANAEVEEWRGYFMVQAQRAELDQLKANASRGR